jgi:DNA-directed RNA polymerase subunit RPC12/RpoP
VNAKNENGFYTDESNESVIFNKHLKIKEQYINCPTCGAGLTIKDGQSVYVCSVCDDEVSILNDSILNHSLYYGFYRNECE